MNTLNATSETLAVHGGAHRPLPVRAKYLCDEAGAGDGMLLQGFPRGGCTACRHRIVSSVARGDGLTWGNSQPVHNFTDKLPNDSCLVRAALNGVAADFVFIPFFHSSTDNPKGQRNHG